MTKADLNAVWQDRVAQLEKAVGEVLEQLAQHYLPRSSEDQDELSNQVRVL